MHLLNCQLSWITKYIVVSICTALSSKNWIDTTYKQIFILISFFHLTGRPILNFPLFRWCWWKFLPKRVLNQFFKSSWSQVSLCLIYVLICEYDITHTFKKKFGLSSTDACINILHTIKSVDFIWPCVVIYRTSRSFL